MRYRTAAPIFTKTMKNKNAKPKVCLSHSQDTLMRKSQIQMGENIIILFIFFVLLVFAIVFFTRLQSAKTEQKIDVDVTGRGLQIAQRVSFLPEVQCTKDNAEVFSGCYDEYSVKALAKLAEKGENSQYYYSIFGNSNISIKKIFPGNNELSNVIYENPKKDYTSITTTNVPISLCSFKSASSRKGDCSFAVLKVEVYN